MKVDKAISRIAWRMNDGGWKANETDAEAINAIIQHVNETRKAIVSQNDLFARLFVETMRRTVKVQGVNITDKNATRWIAEAMEIPFHQHAQLLTDELNEQSVFKKLQSKGIQFKHPVLKTNIEKEKDNDVMLENYVEILKDEWDLKTVEYFLTSAITHLITKFND